MKWRLSNPLTARNTGVLFDFEHLSIRAWNLFRISIFEFFTVEGVNTP
jgi:hypothetical protein